MSARILIIEDKQTNMELMVYLLQAFGYLPLVAYDGEEGLQVAKRENPDLILCDVHLPKRDGYEVVKQLKNTPTLNHIPVIAVTALAMVGDREKLLTGGFDGYIGKPIDPEIFVSQVEHFLPVVLHSGGISVLEPTVTYAIPSSISHPATLLMVDDNKINLELMRSIFEPLGYRVLLAENVQQGWEYAQNDAIDLIMCDVHMPLHEDGFLFLQKIKADPRLLTIPFLFLSASTNNHADIQRAIELGASRFMRSPIDPQLLMGEIENCLRESKRSAVNGYHINS